MDRASKERLINVGNGVRLSAFESLHPPQSSRGLLVLIHGWLGGASSSYIVRTGRYFFDQGYDIFRLNLRDHGETYHLNEGAFNGSLIAETYEGVRLGVTDCLARAGRGLPVFLAGFSLGGNFVLRIALRHSSHKKKIPNLAHCIAVSPAINPERATEMIDESRILRAYFLRKWRRELKKKQESFPSKYTMDDLMKARSVMELTDKVVPAHTEFPDTKAYFSSYTITQASLATIKLATTILTSADDPIIDAADFTRLKNTSKVSLAVERYGGHNGFVNSLEFDCWYVEVMERILTSFQNEAGARILKKSRTRKVTKNGGKQKSGQKRPRAAGARAKKKKGSR
ncbi:MAG: alpha/beta fold hydrolase [Spirochaetia bacterium]|nr:alpha/beta fold hydrolase [Spirochaetia bacterium]